MPKKEEVYVCKKCGYVLPKKDACMHFNPQTQTQISRRAYVKLDMTFRFCARPTIF